MIPAVSRQQFPTDRWSFRASRFQRATLSSPNVQFGERAAAVSKPGDLLASPTLGAVLALAQKSEPLTFEWASDAASLVDAPDETRKERIA
jgi:hypothetical protein